MAKKAAPVKKATVAKKAAPAKKVAPAKKAAPAKTAAPAAKAAAKKPAAKKAAVPTTKSQILAALAERSDLTKKQAAATYDVLLGIAYDGAKLPKGIMLPGLGKLIKVKRPARKGHNPATGEPIKIAAKTVVKFRIAKAAKDEILK